MGVNSGGEGEWAFSASLEIGIFDNSCNDRLFSGMKLTLHRTQVQCLVSCRDELAYGSLMSTHLSAEVGCET